MDGDGLVCEGAYLVGKQLPAGDYRVVMADKAPLSSYSVYSGIVGSGKEELIKFEVLHGETELTLEAGDYSLLLYKHCLSAIVLWTNSKVNPDCTISVLLDENFVIVLLRLIRVVHQDHRISHCLLNASDSDIHGAPRQMITRRRTSHLLIQLRTPIPAINHDRLFGIYFPS